MLTRSRSNLVLRQFTLLLIFVFTLAFAFLFSFINFKIVIVESLYVHLNENRSLWTITITIWCETNLFSIYAQSFRIFIILPYDTFRYFNRLSAYSNPLRFFVSFVDFRRFWRIERERKKSVVSYDLKYYCFRTQPDKEKKYWYFCGKVRRDIKKTRIEQFWFQRW